MQFKQRTLIQIFSHFQHFTYSFSNFATDIWNRSFSSASIFCDDDTTEFDFVTHVTDCPLIANVLCGCIVFLFENNI